ncbi:MAG: YfiR family protein [Paenacidovorax caeni]
MASPMPMALPALLALLLMLAPLAARAQATAGAVSEYAVKSGLAVQVAALRLPAAFRGGTSVTLCVLGQNPFGGAPASWRKPRSTGAPSWYASRFGQRGRRVRLRLCRGLVKPHLKATLDKLGEQPVVTVLDIEGFASAGGMVEFAVNKEGGGSLAVLINRKAAHAQSVKFNAQLLRLARIVE